nr:hypothetical protein CFP56_72499 [Quercus suber]
MPTGTGFQDDLHRCCSTRSDGKSSYWFRGQARARVFQSSPCISSLRDGRLYDELQKAGDRLINFISLSFSCPWNMSFCFEAILGHNVLQQLTTPVDPAALLKVMTSSRSAVATCNTCNPKIQDA